jgi:hypothetical protein
MAHRDGRWTPWFAWRPVRLQGGQWRWGRLVAKNLFGNARALYRDIPSEGLPEWATQGEDNDIDRLRIRWREFN